MNNTKQELSSEDIQDLADIVFHQLNDADHQLKKYCDIVSNYVLVPEFRFEGCTEEQAVNCTKLFGGKVAHLNSLFTKLKSMGAE